MIYIFLAKKNMATISFILVITLTALVAFLIFLIYIYDQGN